MQPSDAVFEAANRSGQQTRAAQMGKAGGKASTDAKAAAARENGRRGGRPKKSGGLLAA